MKFFDPKEEVIDIELTQEGKRLLSQGRFRPSYYSFFDDDILYDVQYAGYLEEQNKSLGRVRDDTPRVRVQYNRNGVETSFKKLKDPNLFKRDISNVALDRNNVILPLGTSVGNQYSPAWKIRLAEGEFVGPIQYYSASWGYAPIPQLSASMEVVTGVEFDEMRAAEGSLGASAAGVQGRPLSNPDTMGRNAITIDELGKEVYDDGSYLTTTQPSILIDLVELNNQFEQENFDIEVFEIVQQSVGTTENQREILRPLWFMTPQDYGSTGDVEVGDEPQSPDPNYSQHYVHVYADGELDSDALDKIHGRKRATGATQSPYGLGDGSDDERKEPC